MPGGYVGLATVGGTAWVSNQRGYLIYAPGFRRVPLPGLSLSSSSGPDAIGGNTATGSIAAGGGLVWIANEAEPIAYSLDGSSGRPKQTALDGAGGSTSIDVTDTYVWFGRTDGRVTRLDPIRGGITSFATGGQVTDIAAGPDAVWVADGSARVVRRVAPDSGLVVTIPVGGQPGGLAVAPDGSVWATLRAP